MKDEIEAILYRYTCPDVETLVAYQEQHLDEAAYLVVHAHVRGCPLCQEEINAMNAVDAMPLVSDSPIEVIGQGMRRIVEAFAQPKTALGALGNNVIYDSPHLQIGLSTETMPGKARTWILSGDVRTPERLPAGQLVESVQVQRIDRPDQPPVVGTLDEDGSFDIADLPSGVYRLHLLTAHEEIIIRELPVGETV